MTARPDGWTGGDPDDFTPLTLVRVSARMARTFAAVLAPFNLPPGQFSVLLNLVEHPGCSQADLARTVLATPQSVGELLRVMEERGTVVRTPPEGRGKPSAVFASDAGRALLEEVTPHLLAAFAPEAMGLDRRGAQRLNRDLHTVLAALSH